MREGRLHPILPVNIFELILYINGVSQAIFDSFNRIFIELFVWVVYFSSYHFLISFKQCHLSVSGYHRIRTILVLSPDVFLKVWPAESAEKSGSTRMGLSDFINKFRPCDNVSVLPIPIPILRFRF